MSDTVGYGIYKYDRAMKLKQAVERVPAQIQHNNAASTLAGQRKFSIPSEIKEVGRDVMGLRVRERKRVKFVDQEELDKLNDFENTRAQGDRGVGGYDQDPDKLLKDKSIAAEVKEERKPDDAVSNQINNGGTGAFSGGWNKAELEDKHDIVPAAAKMVDTKRVKLVDKEPL